MVTPNAEILASGLYKESFDGGCVQLMLGSGGIVMLGTSITFVFAVVLPFAARGTGALGFAVSLLSWLWYSVCLLIYAATEFQYWGKNPPGFHPDARCWLSKELSERASIKLALLGFFYIKVMACLAARDVGTGGLKVYRIFHKLIVAVVSLSLIPRGIASLAAVFGYQWAFCYLWSVSAAAIYCSTKITLNSHFLFLGVLEQVRTDPDNAEKKQQAIEGLQAVEALSGAADEGGNYEEGAGETGPRTGEQLQQDLSDPEAIDRHSKLFDSKLLAQKLFFVVLTTCTIYFAVIAFDYQYGHNGMSYADSFKLNIRIRPDFDSVFSGFSSLDGFNKAYVAALFS